MESAREFETDVPARLDRLPWSHFHWLVAGTLGITWLLDGLEVTLAGSISGALTESPSLALTPTQVGMSASAYLAGAVLGSLFFGHLTDRLGRKRLFSVTLGVYLAGTALTSGGRSWAPAWCSRLRASSQMEANSRQRSLNMAWDLGIATGNCLSV